MHTTTTLGLDIAKSVFQVHGIDADGNVVVRRQLKRRWGDDDYAVVDDTNVGRIYNAPQS